MVNDCCVTLHNAIHVEVASKAGVGDLLVLETLDGDLDSFGSRSASLEVSYTHASSSIDMSVQSFRRARSKLTRYRLRGGPFRS